MLLPTLLILAALSALTGGYLVWRGARGRVVGDHPMCGQCGFDLVGTPPEARRCSECGADLEGADAVAIGARQRRWRVAAVGAALLVPGLGLPAVVGWGRANNVDWQQRKPVWWLAREAESRDAQVSLPALRELLARSKAGTLSKQQSADLVARALRAQADATRPWLGEWGDVVEQSRRAGDVTDEQWATYARQAVRDLVQFRTREKIRRDGRIRGRLALGAARVGRGRDLTAYIRVDALEIGGHDLMAGTKPMDVAWRVLAAIPAALAGGEFAPRGRAALEGAPDGPQAGVMRGRIRVVDGPTPSQRAIPLTTVPPPTSNPEAIRKWVADRQQSMRALYSGDLQTALADVNFEVPLKFELVGRETPLARPVVDEKLRAEVQRCIRVAEVRLSDVVPHVTFRAVRPPVDLAFKIFVRDGDRELPVGTTAYSRADGAMQTRLGGIPHFEGDGRPSPVLKATTVDVILRPDAGVAEETADIVEFWGEEVVFRDVTVLGRGEGTRTRVRSFTVPRAGPTPTSPPATQR